MEKILSPGFFGPDGIWLYDVPGQDDEVTFEDVASKHPVLAKWITEITELCKRLSLNLT